MLTPDGAKGYWTQSGVVLRIQDMQTLQKVYCDLTKTKLEGKSYEQVYVKVDDLSYVTDRGKRHPRAGVQQHLLDEPAA